MSSIAYAALWVFVFAIPWEKMVSPSPASPSSRG